MGGDTRLNLLLTPSPRLPGATGGSQAWHQTLTHLLLPLGVRTFEATSGPQAMEFIEKYPIHLAVVDTRLPAISGMNVLQLIQRLREQGQSPASPQSPPVTQPGQPDAGIHFKMEVREQRTEGQRRIEVRFDARPAPPPGSPEQRGPVVILIAPPPPQQDKQLLQEALKFNAFSVLSEPVDVNLALDLMARALKRFHQNQWPT